jgi:iron complex transport system substrate-binding protein
MENLWYHVRRSVRILRKISLKGNFKMKKIAFILSVCMILTLALTLAACGEDNGGGISGNSENSGSDLPSERTVTGLDGSTIKVPAEINKAVSLSPTATVILSGLGLDAKLVGIDSVSASLSKAPSVQTTDAAGAAALTPDVVFAPADTDVSAIEAAGIPVVKIPLPETVAGINDTIRVAGKVMNVSDAAETMITSVSNAINVAQQMMTVKYSFFLDLGDLKTTGAGTYLNEMISASGGANIFSDKEGLITVTDEEVVAANPEFIFTAGSADALKSRAGWENIDAVVNGNVYELPSSEIVYASQDIIATIQFIYETILDVKE